MSSYDPIDEALNTNSSIEVSNTPENGCVRRKDEMRDVSEEIQKDYEYTRANLYSLIEKGQESLNGIMELQKKVKEIDEDKNKTTNNVTNNAVFVGSTSELSKMLNQGFKK